jgi:hypothetical protein
MLLWLLLVSSTYCSMSVAVAVAATAAAGSVSGAAGAEVWSNGLMDSTTTRLTFCCFFHNAANQELVPERNPIK